MLSDTVEPKKTMQNMKFVGLLIFALLAMTFFIDPTSSTTLLALLGSPEQPSIVHRIILSALLSAVFVGFLFTSSFLKRREQAILAWVFLAGLLILFFVLFDLSLSFIWEKLPFLLYQGVTTTLYISAVSIVLASILGLVTAIAKLSGNGMANGIATFYTSLFRGLPLLVQVYLIYIGLPQLGFVIEAIPAGIAALSLCFGAYMAEVFRAGIESIPRGQWEASRALGLETPKILRKIILPQSVPVIVPPIGNFFISMLKDSSLVSVIGVWELMYLARTLGNNTFQHMEMLITASMIYWSLTMILEWVQSRIEKKYNFSK